MRHEDDGRTLVLDRGDLPTITGENGVFNTPGGGIWPIPPPISALLPEAMAAVPETEVVLWEHTDGRRFFMKDCQGGVSRHGACAHGRVLTFFGPDDDRCETHWPDGSKTYGYPPRVDGLSDEYGGIKVTVCIDCHQVLGLPTADKILAVQQEYAEEDR